MIPILLLALAFLPPWTPACLQEQEEATPAELEWDSLQQSIAVKVLRYRESSEEDQKRMNFQKEMAAIGGFVRKYAESEPDYASAARVFLAREILSSVLGQDREAIQVLRSVTSQAQSPLVAGLAAVHAAEILLRLGDDVGITEIRELYVSRPVHEDQFAGMLQDIERRAALRPGKPFPELKLKDLAGRPQTVAGNRGRVLLVFVFNVEHPGSRAFLVAATKVARTRGDEGLAVLGISVDLDRKLLQKAVTDAAIGFPICHEELGWTSPVVKQLGISSIPRSFLLDPTGHIQFVNPPAAQLSAFVDSALEASRQAGLLQLGDGEEDGGGRDGE